jgi:hypothetical protein
MLNLQLLIAGGLVLLLILIFSLSLVKDQKKKYFLFRGMNLELFLVTLPQETIKEKEFSLQEYFKNVEQFYSSLMGIKEKNFLKRIFLGNPYLVFEIAVHRVGEEIYFYFACPRYLSQLVEKQILGFWPKAQIHSTSDYNIFNPVGKAAGAIVTLTRDPIYPLKPYQEFTSDPLSAITSVFTKLAKEGEGAAIQILIRPTKILLKKRGEKAITFIQTGTKTEEAIMKTREREIVKKLETAISPQKEQLSTQSLQKFPTLTPIQQIQVSAIAQKSSQFLFETNLRILTSAPTEVRASEILSQFQTAFDQFNSPILNQLKFRKLSGRKLLRLFYYFSFRIFDENAKMLLSPAELTTIFHFPSPTLQTPYVKWLKTKQAPAPANLPKEGIILGKNVYRGEERLVPILPDDRRRHFYIVGQTGTGKSVFLQEMIRQDIQSGQGVALIDPHGDLAEKVLGFVPKERIEDVIYFNPADFERPLGLNMLEYDPLYPESKTFVVNELLEIFEKLYNLKAHGFGGPMFEQYMRNSLLLVMEDPKSGNTLIEVPRVLADANFRKYKLSRCRNVIVKNFWELEAEKAGGEIALANMVPYLTSKMNIFIANDLVRPIIAQPKSSINFREIMDQGKILIVNLCKGKLGDINSYLLGMIIVGKILIAAFSRADLPEEKRRDFYLYIDEFHNVTTKTISTVLAEARKYRLTLIMAHQYIGQLDEETRKAIFGNVGSVLSFRVGPDDAKYLVSQFGPIFDENDLVNLDNYNGALRLLIKGETSKPFSIVTFPPTKPNPEIAQLVKEHSRLKYGKPRERVERDLQKRLSKSYLSA